MPPQNSGWGAPPRIPQGQMPYQAASQRKGHAWGLIIALVIFIILFSGAAGFAAWAYAGRQDYKNNVDQKVNAAVTIAKQQTATEKDKEFVEKEKNPFKEYKGPSNFASIDIMYPKTWSAFVTENDKSTIPVDGYFHPSWVPGTQSGTAFALRVQVTNQAYDQELRQFESKTKAGKVKVSPYKAPKVPDILGTRVEGEVNNGQQDVMILFPVRDKTLKISTESPQFVDDFDGIIMANLTFSP